MMTHTVVRWLMVALGTISLVGAVFLSYRLIMTGLDIRFDEFNEPKEDGE